jgi:nucleotide-binding universal stress UspA family protein
MVETVKVQVAATAGRRPVIRRREMHGIVVGIDGSHHSTRALEWALREGVLQQAPVTVLTVHSVPASPWTGNPYLVEADPEDQEKLLHAAEELTQKVASQLGESRPPSVKVRAIIGFPAKELIEASRDADLVVVGSRGAGGFAKLMVGSVSSQVLEHAHCPVVVVPSDR